MCFLDQVKSLRPPLNTKSYLASLKLVWKSTHIAENSVRKEAYEIFVQVYFDCPSKYPAKRVLASLFQNLEDETRQFFEDTMVQQLSKILDLNQQKNEDAKMARHIVDTIGSLLENFPIGERCLGSMAMKVIRFLVQAEIFFLSHVQKDVPPILLHEVLLHCHVTVQTLNLIMQKTVTQITSQITDDVTLMSNMFDFDLKILTNELFLLDCRCCCAMNVILLLQLGLHVKNPRYQIPALLIPKVFSHEYSPSIPWLNDAQKSCLNMEDLSTMAYLALAFGYIAMVSNAAVIVETQRGHNFFVDYLLPDLLHRGNLCEDTVSKALFGKSVSLWTSKLLTSLQGIEVGSKLAEKLNGNSPAMHSLLDYVWTHWEDQLDVVRQNAKLVFENVLKIHSKIASINGKPDVFICSIMEHIFAVSWTSKGKFTALSSCVRLIGTSHVLAIRSNLPLEVVQQLEEQALSCYASELYCTLFTSHHQELKSKEIGDKWKSVFLLTWIEPVVKAMCCDSKKLKQNIIEYLLPKLMKHGDEILDYMILKLSSTSQDQHEPCYGAVIMCLRRARVLGLLKPLPHSDNTKHSLWYGRLHPDVLKAALCSLDQQIRLDAFALLCENHKTTEVITLFEVNMMKYFIPCNLNNQAPAFRQSFVSLLKKFFARMKESLASTKRNAKKDNDPQSHNISIQHCQDFLSWLAKHLLYSLYPGSAFARRTTSLAVLSLMTRCFSTETDGFSLPAILTSQDKQILLECLTDTFEENKKEAYNVLSSYMEHCQTVWDKKGLTKILEISMKLSCSTRPQDCDTAVYYFLLILKQQVFQPSSYELSEMLPHNLFPVIKPTCTVKHTALFLLNSLLALLDDEIAVANQSLITAAANRPMYPTLHCIRYIMQEINFKFLEPDLHPAAKEFINCLINSCLTLSRVVSPVVQNSSPEGNIPEDVLYGPGFDVSNNFGEESHGTESKEEEKIQGKQTLAESIKLSRALVESMPEYLIVCCWRSIKEVSLILGKMCLQIPVNMILDVDHLSLLTLQQIHMLGQYFSEQLLESIHRGAFELAYAGFQLMCQMLWSHPQSSFHQLPGLWLTQVINDIKSGDPNSRFCLTRRSAGVPFFVQAITSSEPAATGRKCFHQVMKDLLALATEQQTVGQADVTKGGKGAQVHAVNILRSLYRDARLGEDVLPYVTDGLKAAILGFKSEQWAVRNSATLLLSALMTRIFGVKRSKDETAMSKKNCQTGRSFFHRYPSLYPFLLSELEEATVNIGSSDRLQLHPSLYPVLLVLGRLFPSTLESSDANLSLSAFIPYVISCASSPVYKTRIIASRALLPLTRKSQVIGISQQLFANIPTSIGHNTHVSNSLIHGSLLQLCQLMKLVEDLDAGTMADTVELMVRRILERTWLMSSCTNRSYANHQATLVLTDMVLDLTEACGRLKSTPELKSFFLKSLLKGGNCPELIWQPLYFDLEQTRARLCLKYLATFNWKESHLKNSDTSIGNLEKDFKGKEQLQGARTVVLGLLQSPIYEVRLGVLETLLKAMGWNGSNEKFDVDDCTPDRADNGQEEWSASSGKISIGLNKASLEELIDQLFYPLLNMALKTEKHHQCLEKMFYVLATIPTCDQSLAMKDLPTLTEIFQMLIARMATERRLEVRAATLRFSGLLVSVLYGKLTVSSDDDDDLSTQVQQLFATLTQMLKSYSVVDDSPDLQISCCHVLLHNVKTLLLDSKDKLGDIIFNCWDSLANLLQEDDLDVKEVAASVVCAIHGLKSGAYHPSFALFSLPAVLLFHFGDRNLKGVITCFLGWILDDSSIDVKESSERLFDKGEMNTYLDPVAFARCIASNLTLVLGVDHTEAAAKLLNISSDILDTEINTDHLSKTWPDCFADEKFKRYLTDKTVSLTEGLHQMLDCCLKTDRYLNSGRYMTLCHMVFRARIFILLFKNQSYLLSPELQTSFTNLDKTLSSLVETFDLCNILTS